MKEIRLSFFLYLVVVFGGKISAQNKRDFIQKSTADYISKLKVQTFDYSGENLFRVKSDFNNDGLEDLMISGYYTGEWGNAGGYWKLYFQKKDGGFKICSTELFMHHLAAYYNLKDNKIIVYNRLGCCEGLLKFFNFKNDKINLIRSEKLKSESSNGIFIILDSILESNLNLRRIAFEKSKFKKDKLLKWE